jgi:hypothetical protein
MITYTDKVKKKKQNPKRKYSKENEKKNTSSQLGLTRQTYDLNCETIII